MKLYFKLLLAPSFLLLGGCSAVDENLYSSMLSEDMEGSVFEGTRSTESFESDWENMNDVTLANGSKLMLPWSIEATTPLDYEARKNIKKEDGWMVVAHSFNRPDYVNRPLDYIALYNQASGHLKIFIDNNRGITTHNTAFWSIYFTKPQAWINGLCEVSLPSSYQFKSSFKWETSVFPAQGKDCIEPGWNVLEIPSVAYDPNSPSDIAIQIGTYANTTTLVDLLGWTQGKINGTVSAASTNTTSSVESSLTTLYGDEAAKWANKTLGVSVGGTNKGDIVSALVDAGAPKVLTGMSGSSSSNSGSGQTSSAQEVKLSLQSTTEIKGKLVTKSPTGMPSAGFAIGKDVTGVELGAWNLTENPIIYMHPVGVMYNSFNGIQSDEAQYLFTASGKSKADIVINPQLKPHVVSYKVECVPVMYSPNNHDITKLPQIPVSDYTYSDYGSLGAKEGVSSYNPHSPKNSIIYSDDNFHITDNNAQGTSTYWRIWDKYGKYSTRMPLYKYIYAPDNSDICRGGEIKVGCKYNYAKVIVTMVTEFEGKRHTIVTSRTYKPRFEWDPEQIRNYKGTTMSGLQGKAWSDPVLSKIDNGYYDQLMRSVTSYSINRKDSVEVLDVKTVTE